MKNYLNYFGVPFATLTLLTACNAPPQQGPGTAAVSNQTAPTGSTNTASTPNSASSAASGTPTPSASPEADAPLALIYKGLGSCSEDQGDAGTPAYGCSEAAADSAVLAGFRYQFVGPTDLPDDATAAQVAAIFGNAKIWIQPGGISNVAYDTMTTKLKSEIVSFVSGGGGFVGFCAGAFLGADWFYLLSATADAYPYTTLRSDLTYTFLPITWNGTKREIYFEGGPYFHNIGKDVETTATFANGESAAIRGAYGKGRVYLSGPHPEAPSLWSTEDGEKDPDGSDHDLAAGMMTWAAAL